MKRHTGLVLCIGGFLLIGYASYQVASGRIYQAWRGRELDRALDSLPPQPASHRSIAYDQGSAIGRLEVPRIGLSVVVLEGSDTGTLRLGVGRVRNSSLPGEPGNVVLAGHRDTFFRSLREIRPGDRISLRTAEGTFPYTVDWTTVVNPKDTSVIMPTASPALTLVTCYPFSYVGSAPQRFIVRAMPAGAMSSTVPASRRPSPFGGPAKPLSHAVARPVSTEQSVAMTSTLAARVELPLSTPMEFAKPAPAVPTAAPVDNPQSATDASADPSTDRRKSPVKRAFHKIAGVFSPRRDKLQ
jgi:sortase A